MLWKLLHLDTSRNCRIINYKETIECLLNGALRYSYENSEIKETVGLPLKNLHGAVKGGT